MFSLNILAEVDLVEKMVPVDLQEDENLVLRELISKDAGVVINWKASANDNATDFRCY